MQYPIIHDGRRIGVLETRREGAYMRFEARCAFLPGVRRLFLYGGGRSAPLGIPQPEGGALVLRRRFSRAAMRAFPAPIEYAGFEEKTQTAARRPCARRKRRRTQSPFISPRRACAISRCPARCAAPRPARACASSTAGAGCYFAVEKRGGLRYNDPIIQRNGAMICA